VDIDWQIEQGWMIRYKLGQAQARFPEVCVASLAVVEDKPGQTRVIHDGSNKVQMNHRIKVQDAEQCPSALDPQTAVREDEELSGPILSLVADVSKAHRRIPVHEQDWGRMACSIKPRPPEASLVDWDILVNTVGTYGFASMSWWWGRLGALFQRLGYYCCQMAYLFRFADDYMLLSANRGQVRCTRPILRFLLLANLLGIPLKWAKMRGGLSCDFIGNFFNWEKMTGGLSESRARWVVAWARRVASAQVADARELRSALGRLSFSTALLRYILPFLGPLYAWVSTMPDGAVRPMPAALVVILNWIADRVEERPTVPLRRITTVRKLWFMADAKAEGNDVIIGGYEVIAGEDVSGSRWFSYRLDPVSAPWAFCKQGQAFRTIAALELYATLMCIMLFAPAADGTSEVSLMMSGITDNQGNEALIAKNMTSKFPLYLILLELTEQLRVKNWCMELEWTRRENNQKADDLSNEDWKEFCPALRLNPELSDLPWLVLPKLTLQALALQQVLAEAKEAGAKRKLPHVPGAANRKVKGKSFRLMQPW
jgi:hypothetical protein